MSKHEQNQVNLERVRSTFRDPFSNEYRLIERTSPFYKETLGIPSGLTWVGLVFEQADANYIDEILSQVPSVVPSNHPNFQKVVELLLALLPDEGRKRLEIVLGNPRLQAVYVSGSGKWNPSLISIGIVDEGPGTDAFCALKLICVLQPTPPGQTPPGPAPL